MSEPPRPSLPAAGGASSSPASPKDVQPEASRQPATAPEGVGPAWLRGALVVPVALVLFASIALALFLGLTLLGQGRDLPDELVPTSPRGQVMLTAISYLALIPLLWVGWIFLDRRPLSELGYVGPTRRALRDLGLGVLLGVAMMAAIVGPGVALGGWALRPGEGLAALPAQLLWVPVLLVAAHFEELLLRGYALQDLGRRRPWLAVAATSLVFAALHLANPNLLGAGWTGALLAAANIVLAGVWLATLLLRSAGLWLPTGAHLGWNWAQGVLFGLPVSGIRFPSFVDGEIADAGALTGTEFGPESSLLALGVLGILCAEGAWRVVRDRRRVPVVEAAVARAEAAAAARSSVPDPDVPPRSPGSETPGSAPRP